MLKVSLMIGTATLPEYFNFDKVLKAVAKSVGNKSYDECLSNVSPDELAEQVEHRRANVQQD